MSQDSASATRIQRRLTIGVNIASADIRKTARDLDEMLKRIDHAHGPFEIDVAISVNPLAVGVDRIFEKPPVTNTTIVEGGYEVIEGDDGDAETGVA